LQWLNTIITIDSDLLHEFLSDSREAGVSKLRVPRLCNGNFSTELFSRYQRSEQAFILALMEMVVNGVSTRKVSEIMENKWAGGRKYLDMVDYYEHVLLRQPKPSPKICYL